MQDLKAPGKQPLPCFLTSSTPADRPRPVPKPGMTGVPVTPSGPHSRAGLSMSCPRTQGRERLSPGLHPLLQQLASAVSVYTCWFCLNVALCRPEMSHSCISTAPGPRSKKEKAGYVSLWQCLHAEDECQWGGYSRDVTLWAHLICPEPYPLWTNTTPPGARAHPGPWGYILMPFPPARPPSAGTLSSPPRYGPLLGERFRATPKCCEPEKRPLLKEKAGSRHGCIC